MDSQSNRTNFDITTTEEDQLLDIAESGTKTSYKAQALLYLAKTIEFPVELPVLANGGDTWYTSFKNLQDKVSAIYPNPSNHTATLSYDLDSRETALFILYSPIGQVLNTATFIDSGEYLIDVHNYTASLYFYSVSINGSPVTVNKFLIVK
ncbi:MAG: T9SS type A sorting domain-containing protein [Sphingobacteriales bacterium]|nr:MAG: T9SS type A sorting domain-containing protein [Sphingobacteriales bacterium]